MIVIYLLIPLSILIAAGFLAGFIWAVRSGQYEDTCTPSMRMLLDDIAKPPVSHEPRSRFPSLRREQGRIEPIFGARTILKCPNSKTNK